MKPRVQRRRRGRRGDLDREAVRQRRRGGRALVERGGHHREVRRVAQPPARRVGRQPVGAAQRVDGGRRELDGLLLDGGEAEADPHDRDRVQVGDERRGVLPALTHDDIRAELGDGRAQRRERGAAVDVGEELADHPRVGVLEGHPHDLLHERPPLLGWRVADRRVRQPGALDVSAVLRLRGDEHVMAGVAAGVRERDERQQVPGAATGCEEHAHGPRVSASVAA